jgi:malonate-semialdehyde dehydrogenase (acetylating) / methylmalonate-semialdehyde dehydrogenase
MSTSSLKGHYIGAQEFSPNAEKSIEVIDPKNGNLLATIPLASQSTINLAVDSAKKGFEIWSKTSVKNRVQVLFKLKHLLETRIEEIASVCASENGKLYAEAVAEIEKGIEVIEFACSLPQIMRQEILEVSSGVDCQIKRYPLGVVAGITPFNFPAMVPLWMIPVALACGNSFILKASEQVPLSPLLIAQFLTEAGLPEGVFNVVHGDKNAVNALLEHKDIKAVGFVGSSAVANIVYEKGILAGKRVLALGGAKNHLIVMPDADPLLTATNVVASAMGAAGQRCMAASVLILVGDTQSILDEIVKEAAMVKVGKDIGSVISFAAKERIEGYISRAEKSGKTILLDGRNPLVPEAEKGSFVGPSIIDGVIASDESACEEIFGPVLSVIRVNSLEEALAIENANPYGNAAAIYTQSGGTARYFSNKASAGMIGINIGVPVPREPFSFGGWNSSRFGQGDITGHDGVDFWTQKKKITSKWDLNAAKNWMS